MMRVARMLKDTGRYEPIFYLGCNYVKIMRDRNAAESEEIKVLSPEQNNYGNKKRDNPSLFQILLSIGRRYALHFGILSLLRKSRQNTWRCLSWFLGILLCIIMPPYFVILLLRGVIYWLLEGLKQIDTIRIIFDYSEYDMLVLPEDNVGYWTAAWIREAHARNIPSVIVPFTLANALEPAAFYYHKPEVEVRGHIRNILARLFPKWVYEYRDKRLFRLPAEIFLAKELLRISVPHPWMLNSGYADVIAVESESVKHYHIDGGISPQRIQVVGNLRQDTLAEKLKNAEMFREELYERLGLPAGKRMLLCAMPPNQFRGDAAPESEFREYKQLATELIRAFKSMVNFNVVVNPHPRLIKEEYDIFEQGGLKLLVEDIATLIPLCDLFVSSASATICMAIACGKPVLNYDVYSYMLTDYDRLKGVVSCKSIEEFRLVLHQIDANDEYYRHICESQKIDAISWGNLDGHVRERMLDLFDKLCF